MKEWLNEVDILKATAILLIVFCHMDNYVSCYTIIRMVDSYAAYLGLSIFFFCSGFLLSRYEPLNNFRNSLLPFYLKKFIRIYPLYWISLASLVLVFGLFNLNAGNVTPYKFTFYNTIMFFFGLQGIFPPYDYFPYYDIQSMWFVGVLVLFLLLYPIISIFFKNLKHFFIISIIIFILLNVLHLFFGLFNINALFYFPIFIAGIFIDRLGRMGLNYSNKKFVIINFFSMSMFIILDILFISENIFNFSIRYLSSILLIGIFISICNLFIAVASMILPINQKIMKLISLIAFGTYAIYLFQHQFLAIFTEFTHLIIKDQIIQDIFILTVGFLGTILFGIFIQKIEQKTISQLRSRLLVIKKLDMLLF